MHFYFVIWLTFSGVMLWNAVVRLSLQFKSVSLEGKIADTSILAEIFLIICNW